MAESEQGAAKKGSTGSSTSKKSTAKKSTARKSTSKKSASKSSPSKSTTSKSTTSRSAPRAQASPRSRTSPAQIATAAVEQLLELTDKPPESVVAISKDGESWVVQVEVLELQRIPSSTDVLASYEVTVDDNGDLTGYKRLRRYVRGTPGED